MYRVGKNRFTVYMKNNAIINKTSLKKRTIQRELKKKSSKMQLYITIIKCKMP